MQPERKTIINGHTIKQYYWNGELVVYIDHRATDEAYLEAIKRLEKEAKVEGDE